jgi:diphthamide synthase (EF-2-diphthine--ammonia ligase)
MISFSTQENIKALRKRLKAIHPAFEEFEAEELILYPHVEERLKRLNITYYTSYRPDNIPPEQV